MMFKGLGYASDEELYQIFFKSLKLSREVFEDIVLLMREIGPNIHI